MDSSYWGRQMKEKIQNVLNVLIGLPFIKANRALNLEMFYFGKRQIVTTRKGNAREIGEYVIHVQSAWRILGPQGIIVASQDRYYPGNDTVNISDNFDWRLSGNRCDKRMEAFVQEHPDDSLIVEAVEADNVGSVSLVFAGGFKLEILPDSSLDDDYAEHWRFFRSGDTTSHFVVMGYGIEE
jgi:hypothetical protein